MTYHWGWGLSNLKADEMLGNMLRNARPLVTQAARGQVRKMSMGEQLKGVQDVKVKDAVRFFSDKAKDPAAQAAARVSPSRNLRVCLHVGPHRTEALLGGQKQLRDRAALARPRQLRPLSVWWVTDAAAGA